MREARGRGGRRRDPTRFALWRRHAHIPHPTPLEGRCCHWQETHEKKESEEHRRPNVSLPPPSLLCPSSVPSLSIVYAAPVCTARGEGEGRGTTPHAHTPPQSAKKAARPGVEAPATAGPTEAARAELTTAGPAERLAPATLQREKVIRVRLAWEGASRPWALRVPRLRLP